MRVGAVVAVLTVESFSPKPRLLVHRGFKLSFDTMIKKHNETRKLLKGKWPSAPKIKVLVGLVLTTANAEENPNYARE